MGQLEDMSVFVQIIDAGRSYYQRAINIIDDVSALNTETSCVDARLDGTLRIAVPLSFGLMHLSDIFDGFSRAHPNLSLKIDFSDRKVDLVEESYELAIRIGELQDSSLQARRFTSIQHVLCASPGYLSEQGNPKDLAALAKHRFLLYGMSNHANLQIIDPAQKTHQIEVASKIAANNGVFLEEMAIAGHGVVFLPSFIVWKSIKDKKLIPILTDHQLPVFNMYAVYPQNRFLSQRARLFIDFMAEKFQALPYWDKN